MDPPPLRPRHRPLVRAGVVLGLGLGGFFDGILFHQVLQWHHLVSGVVEPSATSNLPLVILWDGIFHVLTYALTIAGTVLLLRAWQQGAEPSGRVALGALLVGWGAFDLLDGLVNHHLLGLHHAWPDGPGGQLAWDLAWLAGGGLVLAVGLLLLRRGLGGSARGPGERA